MLHIYVGITINIWLWLGICLYQRSYFKTHANFSYLIFP